MSLGRPQRLVGLVLDRRKTPNQTSSGFELALVRRDAGEVARLSWMSSGLSWRETWTWYFSSPSVEVEALGLGLHRRGVLVVVLAARGEAAADEQGGEHGEWAARGGSRGGAKSTA